MFIIFLSSLHVRVMYIQLTHTLDVEEKEKNKKGTARVPTGKKNIKSKCRSSFTPAVYIRRAARARCFAFNAENERLGVYLVVVVVVLVTMMSTTIVYIPLLCCGYIVHVQFVCTWLCK